MDFVAKAVPMTRQGLANALQKIGRAVERCMQAGPGVDWTQFARICGGPSFTQNQYDVNLNEQYGRFSSGAPPNIASRTTQAGLFLPGYFAGNTEAAFCQKALA